MFGTNSLFETDDLIRQTNKRGLGDFHLRSALLLVDCHRLSNGKGLFREQVAYNKMIKSVRKEFITPGYPVELLCQLCFEDIKPTKMGMREEVIELLSYESTALNKMISKTDLFNQAIKVLRKNDFQRIEFTLRDMLTEALVHLMAITSEREPPNPKYLCKSESCNCFVLKIGTTLIYLFGELITFRVMGNRTMKILSLDSFRMIVDKFTERSNVLLATLIGEHILPEIYPPTERIEKLFLIFDRFLLHRGNEGYKLMKTFEALITGIILKLNPCLYWKSDEFWDNTVSDFDIEEKRVAKDLEELCDLSGTTTHHLTQYMGLFRLWGHPVVSAEKGVEKVRKIGEVKKIVSPYVSEIAGYKLLEIVFMNYFSKSGYYPNFEILDECEGVYLHDVLRGELKINTKDPLYNLRDWSKVLVKKTFEIPSSFNLSMIVADTAISPTRQEMRDQINLGKVGLDPSIRRGVVKWMKDGVLDCPSLLNMVNDEDKGLPKNDRIIGLYQKEREMNPVARMFALMSLIMRAYVVVTESLLSDCILPLIPGITMTYSMLELTKEMIRSTWRQKMDDPNSVTFCINMDFEKWNLNMRKESTFHVFKCLGQLFGLENLFNRTYDIFENSIIYLADGSYKLNIDDNLELLEENPNLAYEGHLGGFEGLRQKGWTIFTVVLIQYCCNQLGVDWKLMGQGDNQVLLVTLYSKYSRIEGITGIRAVEDIKSQLRTLVNLLISTFAEVGLPLKPLETWISDSFFAYGKTPIYRGLPCAMSLKKISRVFYFSNEDIMTLDNAMGSIVTNAQSAAMSDVMPIVPYIIAKWQQLICAYVFLNYHPLIGRSPLPTNRVASFKMREEGKMKEYSNLIKERLIDCCKVITSFPKTLGGINCVTYFNMIMRGFSDPVNMDYQWLYYMEKSANGRYKGMLSNLKHLMINSEKNFSYLLQDPVGLNLLVPTNCSQAIKQMIHRVIESLDYRSPFAVWFKEVMKISDPEEITRLSEELTRGENLNVRFLHDILGSTIFGYCDSITSKVDKTVTLSRIALSSEDVVGKIMKTEEKFINYLFWRITTVGNLENKFLCPSAYIRIARTVGWGKHIEGVSVPFPYAYLTDNEEETERKDSFLLGVCDDNALLSNSLTLSSVGKALPYLGSVTREKLPVSSVRLAYGSEPLISRPIRLLRSIGWFVRQDSNFHELIKNLVQAVTDIDPDDMTMVPDQVKGSMIHRYSDFATKHGSLWLSLHGPATFLNLSTNNFKEFSRGSKNVTLHFQATLCLFQFWMVSRMLSDKKVKVLKLWKKCSECITSIHDDFEDLINTIPKELVPTRPENPYLFLRREQINLQQRKQEERMRIIKRVSLFDLSKEEINEGISDWLGLRVANAIMYHNENSYDGGLLDVSNVSRIIYLKIHPHELLKSITRSLYVMISMGEKYLNKFPTFKVVKEDVLRTVGRSSPKNFTIFSGYYLWPEGIHELRRYGGTFPDTYPATPKSVAIASKRTIMRFISNQTDVTFHKSSIIIAGYESQLSFLLKFSNLHRLYKKESCYYCLHRSLTTHYKSIDVTCPIDLGKCFHGHYFLTLEDINRINYLPDVATDALADQLSSYPKMKDSSKKNLEIKIEKIIKNLTISRTLFSSDNVTSFENQRDKVSLVCNESSSCIETSLDQNFNFPTRALYRMLEILISCPEAREGNLLVMGDGYGLSSLMASAASHRSFKIVSWTYIESSAGISHSLQDSLPPCIYHFSNQIDVSPTFGYVGDVGNPFFSEGFSEVCLKNSIDRLISDIEWWYVGADYTSKLIRLCWKSRIKVVVIRLFLEEVENVFQIVELVKDLYQKWEIVETKNINRLHREVILKMSGPRHVISEGKYLGLRDQKRLIDVLYSYDFLNVTDLLSDRLRMTSFIDTQLKRNEIWMNWIEDVCYNWFSEAEIIGWCEDSFSKMFNGLRTGKRPKYISDMTGSDLYYSHKTWEDKLKQRLLALAFSMVSSFSEIDSALRDKWNLIWFLNKPQRKYRSALKYNIILIRDRCNRRILSKEETSICHYSGMIRSVRERYGMKSEFTSIGDKIGFEFTKRGEKREEVYFLVSKNISYGIANYQNKKKDFQGEQDIDDFFHFQDEYD
ncbi:putative RNA dependent RNA polymerase [rudbeckia virus 1]|uniref:RNA-directed RNA polymerase n=1 Tax=rudbeckia virus 1 TaxID=2971904 RepID=A0AAX3C9B0_9RHAB|nr:putative RNA dependent RNA polymerase [rudbeckia virus 1]